MCSARVLEGPGAVRAAQRRPVCLGVSKERLHQRIAVGLRAKGGGGKKLHGPRQILTSTKEHGGSLATGANNGRSTSPVGRSEGVVRAATLLPLAWSAVEQEVFLAPVPPGLGAAAEEAKRLTLWEERRFEDPLRSVERPSSSSEYSSLP